MRDLRTWVRRPGPIAAVSLILWSVLSAQPALANVSLRAVSTDPYTNTTSYHRTQVEPDTFAVGNTIVSAFQSGRFQNGGASNIGWATSVNGGVKWKHGFLPGTTKFATPAGPYDRDTDPAVAYDASHKTWMIVSLGMTDAGPDGVAILVSRSTKGVKWGSPVAVQTVTSGQSFDKTWIVCDDDAASPFYGNCYVEWDDFGNLDQPHVSTSSDGGATWTEATVPQGIASGGQPLVQPKTGTVIMPIANGLSAAGAIESYTSHDGGVTFEGPFTVSPITAAAVPGGMRAPDLPSAEIDGLGRVYVVWYDCRFEVNCSTNDIVMSTSVDGQTWTPPVAVPINPPTGGTINAFDPGIGVDQTTSGPSAVLGVTYYYFPNTACGSTCQLDVGFISSTNAGLSWGTPTPLAGPITPSWLPNTSQGFMMGDYLSTSFLAGKARTVFASAKAGTCQLGQVTTCKEFMVSPTAGLSALGGRTPVRSAVRYRGPGTAHRIGGLLLLR